MRFERRLRNPKTESNGRKSFSHKNCCRKVHSRSTKMSSNRFAMMVADGVVRLQETSKNHNTTISTNTWVNCYRAWAQCRNESTVLETLVPEDLNLVLCRFYAEIRKQNGKDYEPDCLRVMQSALDRHLKNANYPCSIITDRSFKSSQEVLEGKCRALRAAGIGKKPNRCRPISAAEELECWEKGTLGEYPPKVYCLDL